MVSYSKFRYDTTNCGVLLQTWATTKIYRGAENKGKWNLKNILEDLKSIFLVHFNASDMDLRALHLYVHMQNIKIVLLPVCIFFSSSNKGFRRKYEYYSPKLKTNQVFSQ